MLSSSRKMPWPRAEISVQICQLASRGGDAGRAVPRTLVPGADSPCGALRFCLGWFRRQVKALGHSK